VLGPGPPPAKYQHGPDALGAGVEHGALHPRVDGRGQIEEQFEDRRTAAAAQAEHAREPVGLVERHENAEATFTGRRLEHDHHLVAGGARSNGLHHHQLHALVSLLVASRALATRGSSRRRAAGLLRQDELAGPRSAAGTLVAMDEDHLGRVEDRGGVEPGPAAPSVAGRGISSIERAG
jgi:hypothetical protein